MKDGRLLNAVVMGRTEQLLTLRQVAETRTVDRAEIAKEAQMPVSMMPDGLLESLRPAQNRDLMVSTSACARPSLNTRNNAWTINGLSSTEMQVRAA